MDCLTGFCGWRPSKMPVAKEKNTLLWLWILKLFLLIPVAVLAFTSKDLYHLVASKPELHSPPYNRHVLRAQGLVYIGSVTLFPWLFISSALMWKWRGSRLLLYGLIDFGLAMTIIVGLAYQDKYLPMTTKACCCGKAERWQVSGAHASFFSQAAAYEDKDTPQQKCMRFVSIWQCGVFVAFLHMITCYVGIFFDEREFSILNPFRPLFYLILAVIGPFYWFYVSMFPKIRFGFLYLVGLGRRLHGLRTLRFEKPAPYVPQYETITVTNVKFHQILTIEHVLLNVVEYLHYEDIINLSRASKAVREAVYPGRDLPHRLPKLRKRCCDADSKTVCLLCNKKICKDCKIPRWKFAIPARRHVTSCVPCCSKCYFREFSRRQRDYKPCSCSPLDNKFEYQDVCRSCCEGEWDPKLKAREKRYMQEARDIASGKHLPPGEKPKCAKCGNDFPSATRWWICSKCGGDCRASIHPSSAGRIKDPDEEKAELSIEEKEEGQLPRWISYFWPK